VEENQTMKTKNFDKDVGRKTNRPSHGSSATSEMNLFGIKWDRERGGSGGGVPKKTSVLKITLRPFFRSRKKVARVTEPIRQ